MRRLTWFLVVALSGASAGCSGDDPSPSDTSYAASSGGTGTANGAETLNGCDAATAEDHTGDATVTIATSGLGYSPACVKVKAGTQVTFNSDFAIHPLRGGDASSREEDESSPIEATDSGTTIAFAFPSAGAFGFYCNIHAPSMAGAVFVE